MTFPMDTKHFNPIAGGAPSDASTINAPLAQLSGAITQLEADLLASNSSVPATYGEALTERDAVYLNPADNKVYAIDADSTALFGSIRGFVDATGPLNTVANLVSRGIVSGFPGLTPWLPVYADTTGAGTVTQTPPVPTLDGGQVAIVPMGIAISATEILVMPGFVDNRIHYQKRFSPAQNETLTIEHHSNTNGLGRVVRVYVTANSVLEEYGSANQDAWRSLKDRVPATYTADQCTGGTPSASASGLGAAANAFDNTDATFWGTGFGSGPHWLQYTFAAAKTIRQYTVEAYNAGTGNTSAPNTWTLEYWDGDSWEIADSRSSQSSWALGEKRTYTVSTPFTSTQWRIHITSLNGSTNLAIGEMEMMEVATWTNGVDSLEQGFQLPANGTPGIVRLLLRKIGSPSDNLTVKIETNNSGDASGTPVTNGTTTSISAASLGASGSLISFTLPTPPSLTGSTPYHIVLETDAVSFSETDYVQWGVDESSPFYADGEFQSESSGIWSSEGADGIFQIVDNVVGLQLGSQAKFDHWDSTHADIVNRFGDSGGADFNTKTTFKWIDASGAADIVCEVIL